jgi:sigma-E factor negative regulatory protein RseA
MSQPDSDRSQCRRILSALADGDATDGEAARAFEAWRDDEDARTTWHAYQLIGDVLRSDDLAAEPAADAAFLAALRERLAAEPVVLAPVEAVAQPAAPQRATANGRAGSWSLGRWQAPFAMAAGFLAVIGGMQLVRGPASPGAASVAQAGAASGAVVASVAPAPRVAAKAEAEQVAPYIAAHRQSTMNAAFQMPGGDIRNASLVQTAP